jgi:hypothetical protein
MDIVQNQFPNIPAFPPTVPTAPLLRISLAKLLASDAAEEGRLWDACCNLGFFYLDLRCSADHGGDVDGANGHANGSTVVIGRSVVDGESLLRDADALFDVAKEFFNLPVEEKAKYDFADEGSYFG